VLSGGGRASGPLSFMRASTLSRASSSRAVDAARGQDGDPQHDHPDVEQFIWCKAKEEKKAYTLVDAGYDASLDGEAYSSIFFQNANNSVRATDDFMQAAERDEDWWTKSVSTGQPVRRHKARDLMRQIAEATHQCGDPGMQFDTTVNRWHPCKNTARINARTPARSTCSSTIRLQPIVAEPGEVRRPRRAVSTWKPSATPWTR